MDGGRGRSVNGRILLAMTIASHCLELLAESSPRSAQELADACVAAGLTRARSPVLAVTNALSTHQDEAPELEHGRFGYSLHLLEGCWFTTKQRNGDRLVPSFDISLLNRLLRRRKVPVVSGGELTDSEFDDGLQGPPGWLPEPREAELVAIRLTNGSLEARSARLSAEANTRGADLAARLRRRLPSSQGWWPSYGHGREREVWHALLRLVAEEPELLAEPLPPLSDLLPDMAHRPEVAVQLGNPVVLQLPGIVCQRLEELAAQQDIPFPQWLTDRLHDLAVHGGLPRPARYIDEYDVGWDDAPAPRAGSRWADVLPFRPADESDYQGGWR